MAKKQDGGYPCRFVAKPKELQTDCIICHCILRDPVIVDCCGLKYCRVCINKIETTRGPCPHCQGKNFSTMADKQLKRQLDDRKVYCSNEERGCKWTGELRQLLAHLEESVSNQNVLSNTCCQYQDVPCPRCTAGVQRRFLGKHVKELCPHRDIACVYEYAGCKVKVRQSSMETHLTKNAVEHARLVRGHSQRKSDELAAANKLVATLRTEVNNLRRELSTKIDKNNRAAIKLQTDVTHYNLTLNELKKRVDYNSRSSNIVRYPLLLVIGVVLIVFMYSNYNHRFMTKAEYFIVSSLLGGALVWLLLPNLLDKYKQ